MLVRRLVGVGVAICACVATTAADDVELRIITFNTELGIADTQPRREASGHQVTILDLDGSGPNTALMPDILCLQETRSEAALQAFRNDYLPDYQVVRGTVNNNDPGGNNQAYIFRDDMTLLQFVELSHGGPRRHHRLILEVPGSEEPLVIYNVHFKAGSDGTSINTRRAEANALANRVALDFANGIDTTGNRQPDVFPVYYILAGDLNHDDFSGTVIDALLIGGSGGGDTGLNDARVETLAGAQWGTFIGGTFSTRTGLQRRYDYHLVSDAIYDTFDTDNNGQVTQEELNAAGFSYFSPDDNGLRASGDPDATLVASDHAPVVLNFTLPGTERIPGDVNGDGRVDLVDLGLLLAAFGTSLGQPGYLPEADFNGDGVIDLADLGVLLANFGFGG